MRQKNVQISADSSEQTPFRAQDHAAPIVTPEARGRWRADGRGSLSFAVILSEAKDLHGFQ
jgi:hypothetical protein